MSPVVGRVGVVLAIAAVSSACRLEKRPDLVGSEGTSGTPSISSATPAEDSARAALVAMNSALESGDGALVARLTTPDAVLFDQNERVRWTHADTSAPLPPALSGGADGLGWHLVEASFFFLGPAAAFFSRRYQDSAEEEQTEETAVESWVLVRTEEGWLVRYLHRSSGLMESRSPQE